MHATLARNSSALRASSFKLANAAAAVIEPLERRALLSAGDLLHTEFTDVLAHSDTGGAIVRVDGGKLLQVGVSFDADFNAVFSLARFNADATPDNTFNGGASNLVLDSFPAGHTLAAVNAAAVDPAGRIITVGRADRIGGSDFYVAAFTPDGQLDASFGTGGVVIGDFSDQQNEARALAIAADGTIFVAGGNLFNTDQFDLARFDSSGAGLGIVHTPLLHDLDGTPSVDIVHAMAIDLHGNVILAGSSQAFFAGEDAPVIALQRYAADGTLDINFGDGGSLRLDVLAPGVTALGDKAYSVVVDQRGRILVGGTTDGPVPSSDDFALVRFDTDGNVDNTFGDHGIARTYFGGLTSGLISDMAIQSDGAIVVGGNVLSCTDESCGEGFNSFAIGRYDPAGGLDASFGNGGLVLTQNFAGSRPENNLATIAIQPDATGNPTLALGSWLTRDSDDLVLVRVALSAADVTLSGPASANEGDDLAFTATFSGGIANGIEFNQAQHRAIGAALKPSTIVGYDWTITVDGQAQPIASGFGMATDTLSIPFTPADNGTYHVNISINDGVASASADITVNNVDPTPSILLAPDSSPEGTLISLASNVSDPGMADTFGYAWSVTKNGSPFATGTDSTFSFIPDDDGSYVVTLTVMDDDLGVGSDSRTIAVGNVDPTASINGAPASSPEGVGISLTSGVSDPGTADTFTFAWSVTKNGSLYASGSDSTFAFTPDDNGSYLVSLTVTDDDGGTGIASSTIMVTNVAPTSTINGAPQSSAEGSGVTLTGSASDPGSADTITLAWAVTKNGSAYSSGVGANFSFTPNDNGTYLVTLTATDDDGGGGSDSRTIVVSNVAPSVDPISGPSTAQQGSPQTFSSAFSDPGSADTWTVTWNFGDGSTLTTAAAPGAITASHAFVAAGTYTVSVTVSDDDGGSAAQSTSITISNTNTGVLQIQGTDGDDDIKIKREDGNLLVEFNGVHSTYSGITQIVLTAGAGDDKIKINPDVTQSAIVFGGDGDDSIKTGAGDDILIGGNGDDLLHGNDGRDLIIGGWGSDRILGNADSDILVAGWSRYDADPAALGAILAEWTSARSYGQRSANVMGRDVIVAGVHYTFGGPRNNGNTFLAPDGANATVFDDGDVDILTGNASQDLFLFNSDCGAPDILTGLSANELAVDIDFLNEP